ncbi:hypothetical protein TRVA0_042S00672 [Trichomonascus vanleenenianus]|uniref:uncharacterized protein n=1 Tax=Trichomonascus vanleenenianus TaxID=2268995 RepID=UPI003ECA7067
MRLGWSIGARCTAVRMPTTPPSVAIVSPTPYGPESEKLLEEAGTNNVKYIVALDYIHHAGLQSWKRQFPNAQIIGMEGLAKKKADEGNAVEVIEISDEEGKKDDITSLPAEFTEVFDTVYIPQHQNKELVLFHRASKTVLEADLVTNLPAYEQYNGFRKSATGWLNYITKYFSFNSKVHNVLANQLVSASKARRQLEHIRRWDFVRIVPCHGDIIEGPDTPKAFGEVFRLDS